MKSFFIVIYLILISPFFLFSQNFSEVASSININAGFGSSFFQGGISFCDFNQDGWDDLTFATESGKHLHFYENVNGTYQLLIPAPVLNTHEGKQVLWVDYDNDGDKDFFYSTFNNNVFLYQNDGNFNFTDVSVSANIKIPSNRTFGASFADFDNDGWLDLYICTLSSSYKQSYLLRNNQNGTFTNVTNNHVVNINPNNYQTFCSVFFDFDNDLSPDIATSNDRPGNENSLFKNVNGIYSDASISTGLNININSMNAVAADYDNDSDLDLYHTNLPHTSTCENKLMQNNNGVFSDVGTASGAGFTNLYGSGNPLRVGWGANFFDYDNDLDLDLYVCNSYTADGLSNALYVNDGTGNFTEPLVNGLPNDDVPSYCNAIGDINNDGNLDIAVCNGYPHNFYIWQNNETNSNNWIKIQLEGTIVNRDAIGTWIDAYMGADKRVRYTHCGQAFLAQNSNQHHIGIGIHTQLDSLVIRWQSGNIDKIYNIPANQTIKVKEGEGLVNPLECPDELFLHTVESMNNYDADLIIQSDAILPLSTQIQYRAENCIQMLPTFEVPLGTEFDAFIQGCK